MSNMRRLGEVLVERRLVAERHVEAVAKLRNSGLRLGERLVRLGLLTEPELLGALASQMRLPLLMEIHRAAIPPWILGLVPFAFAAKHRLCPVAVESGPGGDGLALAVADPTDIESLQSAARLTGMTIFPVLSPRREIERALEERAMRIEREREASGTRGLVLVEDDREGDARGVIPLDASELWNTIPTSA